VVQQITHFLENTHGPYYKVVRITSLSPISGCVHAGQRFRPDVMSIYGDHMSLEQEAENLVWENVHSSIYCLLWHLHGSTIKTQVFFIRDTPTDTMMPQTEMFTFSYFFFWEFALSFFQLSMLYHFENWLAWQRWTYFGL